MRNLACVILLWATSIGALGQFQQIIIQYDGLNLEATKVHSLNPLTVEHNGFIDDVFTTLEWVHNGTDFDLIYDSRVGLPAGEDNAIPNTFKLAIPPGEVFAVTSFTTTAGNRGEGFIGKLNGTTFTEFAPRARTALGSGSTARFRYDFPVAASQAEVLAMIGYDNTFPHFLLRVTSGVVNILAQESITDFPGTAEKFTRFAAALNITPDGNTIIFRGETASRTGMCMWNSSTGISAIADSTMNLPGTSTQFTSFFDGSIESYYGPTGTLYLQSFSPQALMSYEAGLLETLLMVGDDVNGSPVQSVGNVQFGPAGNVFVLDGTRVLTYDGVAWTEFQQLNGFQTTDGKSLINEYSVNVDGVYVGGNKFNQQELKLDSSLYRRAFDSSTLEKVLDFTQTPFGPNFTSGRVQIEGDLVLIAGRFLGTVNDFTGGASGFAAFAAGLPQGMRAPGDDPDMDNLPTAIEYLIGTDPGVANPGTGAITIELRTGEELGLTGDMNQYLVLEIRMMKNLPDAAPTPVASQAVATLSTGVAGVTEVGSPVPDGDFEVRTYRSTFTVESADAGFINLAVTVVQ